MSRKSYVIKQKRASSRNVVPICVVKARRTSLVTAWTILSPNKSEHARNIVAKFYERDPKQLQYVYRMEIGDLERNTKKLLKSFETLIEADFDAFKFEIYNIAQEYKESLNVEVVNEIRQIVQSYILTELAGVMSKTLFEAVLSLFDGIESDFAVLLEKSQA